MAIESDYGSGATSIAESIMDVSSDEEYWRAILETAEVPSSGNLGDTTQTRYPCPLRETLSVPSDSKVRKLLGNIVAFMLGREVIPCALASCPMTFPGKEAMRLHYIAIHSQESVVLFETCVGIGCWIGAADGPSVV
jgi:hypothetical protein